MNGRMKTDRMNVSRKEQKQVSQMAKAVVSKKQVKKSESKKVVEAPTETKTGSDVTLLPTEKKSEKLQKELAGRIETLKASVSELTAESSYDEVNKILGHAFYVRNSRVKLDKAIAAEKNPILIGS